MRILVTGGSGVLGRALLPLLAGAGHDVRAPARTALDLFDAALATTTQTYVQPTVAFGEGDERLDSAREAEAQAARFASAGRRGVVLRLGLLDGPGTGNDVPRPVYGVTLHVADAGRALLEALTLPSGIYEVARERQGLVRQLG